MLRIRSLFVCLALIGPAVGAGSDLSGTARIIDGDTIAVAGTTVRLFGIDAPEAAQGCADAQGQPWDCGAWSTATVARLIGDGAVRCAERDVDRYGRIVATCATHGGRDIGEAMTTAGAAVAYRRYSTRYVAAEERAQTAGRGIWAGSVERPESFRTAARRPDLAPRPPAGDCRIKGNISANGQIFHRPGQRDYDRTRIDTGRGERWFCSAAEARAAGWRAARR